MSNEVVFKCGANLFKGIESVGGFIGVTDEFLIFTSHRFNIQSGVNRIPIVDISECKLTNTLGIVPNGFTVITTIGEKYVFVVNKRNELLRVIHNIKSNKKLI